MRRSNDLFTQMTVGVCFLQQSSSHVRKRDVWLFLLMSDFHVVRKSSNVSGNFIVELVGSVGGDFMNGEMDLFMGISSDVEAWTKIITGYMKSDSKDKKAIELLGKTGEHSSTACFGCSLTLWDADQSSEVGLRKNWNDERVWGRIKEGIGTHLAPIWSLSLLSIRGYWADSPLSLLPIHKGLLAATLNTNRIIGSGGESQERHDIELSAYTLQLLNVIVCGLYSPRYDEIGNKRLDYAILTFFQHRRKSYTGKLLEGLAQCAEFVDHTLSLFQGHIVVELSDLDKDNLAQLVEMTVSLGVMGHMMNRQPAELKWDNRGDIWKNLFWLFKLAVELYREVAHIVAQERDKLLEPEFSISTNFKVQLLGRSFFGDQLQLTSLRTNLSKGDGSVPNGKRRGKLEEIAWGGRKLIVTILKYCYVFCSPQLVTTQELHINSPVNRFENYEELEVYGFVVGKKSAMLTSFVMFNLLRDVVIFDSSLTCVDARQYGIVILADLEDEYFEEVIGGCGYSWDGGVFWKNLFWLFSVLVECMTMSISIMKLEDKLVLWEMECYDQVLYWRKRRAATSSWKRIKGRSATSFW